LSGCPRNNASPGCHRVSQTGATVFCASGYRQWIDLAHDVTWSDAELAVREGYDSVEHFKRYTTTGMSVDQGKTSNLNAFLALSALTGRSIEDIGTTTFRPPYVPVTLGAIAGRNLGEFYAPRRLLPAHGVHLQLNARLEDYAGWQRPDYYPRPGEASEEAIMRETRSGQQLEYSTFHPSARSRCADLMPLNSCIVSM
jgi:sarcosine oxidase subunit alpha